MPIPVLFFTIIEFRWICCISRTHTHTHAMYNYAKGSSNPFQLFYAYTSGSNSPQYPDCICYVYIFSQWIIGRRRQFRLCSGFFFGVFLVPIWAYCVFALVMGVLYHYYFSANGKFASNVHGLVAKSCELCMWASVSRKGEWNGNVTLFCRSTSSFLCTVHSIFYFIDIVSRWVGDNSRR